MFKTSIKIFSNKEQSNSSKESNFSFNSLLKLSSSKFL